MTRSDSKQAEKGQEMRKMAELLNVWGTSGPYTVLCN